MQSFFFRFYFVFSFIFFVSFSTFAQYEEIVLKHIGSEYPRPRINQILDQVVTSLGKDPRIEAIPKNGQTNKPIQYFVEGIADYYIQEPNVSTKNFNDSTKTAIVRASFPYGGRVDLMITSVETGKIKNSVTLPFKREYTKEYKVGYSSLGYSPGKKRSSQVMKSINSRAKSSIGGKIKAAKDEIWKSVLNNFAYQGRISAWKLFPYRFELSEVVKSKKGKAKVVKIQHDEQFKITFGEKGIIYSVKEREIDGERVGQFEILGDASRIKDDATSNTFNVKVASGSARKKVMAAVNEGKQLYFSFGNTPYITQKRAEKIKLAVAPIQYPDVFYNETNDEIYFKLRSQLHRYPGVALVERNQLKTILKEKELQKTESYIDKETIDQFSTIGADYLLEWLFTEAPKVSLSEIGGSKTSTTPRNMNEYTARYNFLMRLYEVSTGELIFEDQLRSTPKKEYSKHLSIPQAKMINQMANKMDLQVNEFLSKAIPPKVTCQELLVEKKGKAKRVLIFGDVRFSGGDKFDVIRKTVVEVEGKELDRFSVIGKIALRKRVGDGLIEAKVKDGGAEILQAMKNGEQLFCSDKPSLLEKWVNSSRERSKRYGY